MIGRFSRLIQKKALNNLNVKYFGAAHASKSEVEAHKNNSNSHDHHEVDHHDTHDHEHEEWL
jgi:ABC-type Zn2+ transport system substrate-binding protein/surface adhesin